MLRLTFIYQLLKTAILLFLISVMSSCSPQSRLSRLIDKHPALLESDTIFFRDTIFLQGAVLDTVVQRFYYRTDTVVIHNNGITQRMYYNSLDSSLRSQVECPPDTIFKDRVLIRDKLRVSERFAMHEAIAACIAFLGFLLFTYKFL